MSKSAFGSIGEKLKIIIRKTDDTIITDVNWNDIIWSQVKEIGLKSNSHVIGFHKNLGCIVWYPLTAYTYDKPLFYVFEKAWGKIGTTWHNFYITTSDTPRIPYLISPSEEYLPDERKMGWTGTIPYSGYNFSVDVGVLGKPLGIPNSLKTKITTPINLSNIGIEYQFYLNPEWSSDAEKNIKWIRVYTFIDFDNPDNNIYTDYDISQFMEIINIPEMAIYAFDFYNEDKSKCLGCFDFTDVFTNSQNRLIKIEQVTLPNNITTYCLRLFASFGPKSAGEYLEIDPTFGDANEYTGTIALADWTVIPTKFENIRGELASPTETGTADSISVFLKYLTTSDDVICALYDSTSTLIAYTEQKAITDTTFTWYTFNFSEPKPTVTAGQNYYIVAYGDAANSYPGSATTYAQIAVTKTGVGYYAQLSVNNFPNFPSPATFSLVTGSDVSIYCTYSLISTELYLNVGYSGNEEHIITDGWL